MADFAAAVSGNMADDDMDNSQMASHIEDRRKLAIRLENDPEFKRVYAEGLRKKEADALQNEAQRLIRELSGASAESAESAEPVEEYEEDVQKKQQSNKTDSVRRQSAQQRHVDLDDLVPDEVLDSISRGGGGGLVVHIHINHVHNMHITN
jgi:hypothetical protein